MFATSSFLIHLSMAFGVGLRMPAMILSAFALAFALVDGMTNEVDRPAQDKNRRQQAEHCFCPFIVFTI